MTADQSLPDDEVHREIEHASTERLIFFSDAVTAIALTLLALELPVPEGDTSREMLAAAGSHAYAYLAFAISFLVISAHWRAHHEVFGYVRRVNQRLITLNLAWLFLIVITPFTTQVLAEGETNFLRFATYGVAQALQFGLFAVIVVMIRKNAFLIDPDDRPRLHVPLRRSLVFTFTFGGSVPLYPLLHAYTFGLWWALPLLSNIVRGILRRRRAATA